MELQAEDWGKDDLSVLVQRQRSAIRTRLERLLIRGETGRPALSERMVRAASVLRVVRLAVTRITAHLVAPRCSAWLALVHRQSVRVG